MSKETQIVNPYSERYLLMRTFQPDRSLVRLITYDGIRHERIRKVTQYHLLLANASPLAKLDVLLAYATGNTARFTPYLTTDAEVQALGLRPVKEISQRRFVDMRVAVDDAVAITMHNGIAVRGICQAFSKYNIVLDVCGELLLVYKHGIHAFAKNPY